MTAPVIPAQAGIHGGRSRNDGCRLEAGMTAQAGMTLIES